MGIFKILYGYEEGFEDVSSDTVISTHTRFWRKDSRIEVYYLVIKPSVLSYTGLAGYYVPIRKNIEFIEELLDG